MSLALVLYLEVSVFTSVIMGHVSLRDSMLSGTWSLSERSETCSWTAWIPSFLCALVVFTILGLHVFGDQVVLDIE